ncbi:MAG TPA: nuclear transport factor 2 family protein [Gemmatimonadaceae bacterium]|nr:nuclear transport factor 2 family protein [Gemmatimonadaceae bacterium]
MTSLTTRRRVVLPILCFLASACTAPRADRGASAKDPNTPAVVQAPQVVLVGDTAKKDTAPSAAAGMDGAKRVLASNFAVLGAAIAFGDRQMIGANFAPDAEVVTPDTTYKGVVAIANALGRLGPAKSLRDFQRRSLVMKIVDSTVVDSGIYVVLTKRPRADSVFERGRYSTTWRIHPPPGEWLITHDRLYRDPARKKK